MTRTEPPNPAVTTAPWKWYTKLAISLVLSFHVLAVFIPPFTFATSTGSDASPLAMAVMQPMRPYIDAMFLNHGYFFFAPEPGPSHLMRFELELADGTRLERWYPDRQQQWPRLLYHRHFMLSETLHSSAPPPELTADILLGRETDSEQAQRFLKLRQSFVNHVRQRLVAEDVQLTRVEHLIPAHQDFTRTKVRLTDKSLYVDLTPNLSETPKISTKGEPPWGR